VGVTLRPYQQQSVAEIRHSHCCVKMTDQIEANEQHTPADQRELWFWSEIDEKTYTPSDLTSLSDDLIKRLLSESTAVFVRLNAVTAEINDKKAAGLDWDFEWYVRVRTKKNMTERFIAFVSRELKHREKLAVAAAAAGPRAAQLERQIANLKKKNDSFLEREEREKPQKKYELEKRRKFYKLVIDAIGRTAFEEYMLEAAKSASLLYPGPWVDPRLSATPEP
jgi:hypothetical protein